VSAASRNDQAGEPAAAGLLAALGVSKPDPARYPVVMPVRADTAAAVQARLAEYGVKSRER